MFVRSLFYGKYTEKLVVVFKTVCVGSGSVIIFLTETDPELTSDSDPNPGPDRPGCATVHWLKYYKHHRIIDDRMENSINGRRIQYNIR